MRIAIIGSGALGLYYGALLQRGGHAVRFLLRRDLEAIGDRGLTVTSPNGDFHLDEVAGFLHPTELGEVDLVLVGLKSIANDRLVELVTPLMHNPDAMILTLQNGLGNEDVLAAAFGPQRVLGGVAFLCSNRGEPGVVHHHGQGSVKLGEFQGGRSDRADRLGRMFSAAGIPCEAVADLAKARWEKLVWNIPFNGLCALTGKDVTELLAEPACRSEIQAMTLEVVAGANTQGLSAPIEGDAFTDKMLRASDTMEHYRPSMMLDRLAGQPMELEAIYAEPLRRAAQHGVEMVRVELLAALLRLEL